MIDQENVGYKLLVVYVGPGGITSSQAPSDKYEGAVRLLGHEVVIHENGTTEVLVKWEYA